jgi:hypothetical protein
MHAHEALSAPNRHGHGHSSNSSSSSPSPVGASRRFSCDICGGAELGKYTCPACGVHTCSLPCQRQHKSSSGCPGVRSRCEFVRAEDMGLTTMCRCAAQRPHASPAFSMHDFSWLWFFWHSALTCFAHTEICSSCKMQRLRSTELLAFERTRTSKPCRPLLEPWETSVSGSHSHSRRSRSSLTCRAGCRDI